MHARRGLGTFRGQCPHPWVRLPASEGGRSEIWLSSRFLASDGSRPPTEAPSPASGTLPTSLALCSPHLNVAADLRVVQQPDGAFHLLAERFDAGAPKVDHFHSPPASRHTAAEGEHAPRPRGANARLGAGAALARVDTHTRALAVPDTWARLSPGTAAETGACGHTCPAAQARRAGPSSSPSPSAREPPPRGLLSPPPPVARAPAPPSAWAHLRRVPRARDLSGCTRHLLPRAQNRRRRRQRKGRYSWPGYPDSGLLCRHHRPPLRQAGPGCLLPLQQ